MHPDMSRIGKRVRELRNSLKLTQGPFGRLLGVDQATVSRWESDAQMPESEVLLAIAKLAKKSVEEFLGDSELRPTKIEDVKVIGKVQAGEWVEAWLAPEDDQFEVTVVQNPKYRGLKRFGLEVVGPSMNKIYPEGSFLLCVRFADLGRGAENGERVVVERHRSDGLIEVTVKEYVLDVATQRVWLWPRSDRPEFAQPVPLPTPEDGNGIEDVRITALVTGSYRNE
jgi:repressor LexA